MTHMLSLLPKSRFEESSVEIPGGLAFLADYRPDAIAEAAAGTEGLFMPPSHPRLDADLLARLGSVRIIQTAGAGFDSVDHAAAAKLGLIVCNSPAQNAITVAEHVIGAVICLQRELAYADEAIKSGAYAQARERILDRGACELFGATVGIVGLGGIGRALAPRLAALRGNGRGLRRLLARGFRAGARHPARQSRRTVRRQRHRHPALPAHGRHARPCGRGAARFHEARRDPRQRGARRHRGRNGPCRRPRTRRHPRRGHR